MGRSVTKRKDGHFGVSGTSEGVYYGDERTAKRIAGQLDKADAEKAGKPMAPPKNQNQKKAPAPKAGTTQPAADDVDEGDDVS